MDILKGTLSPAASMKGALSAPATLKGKLSVPQIIVPNPYEGDYVITPRAHDPVTLATMNKTLTDDITVLKIPYYETSNESGMTVYIGNEEELIIGGN